MAMSPEAQSALISGAFGAVGAGLSAAGGAKQSKEDRIAQAYQNRANRMGAPGSEPAAYAKLALKRALFEGLGPGAMSGSIGGAPQAPESMRQFVPNMGPGLNLDPARGAALNYLSDERLAEDRQQRDRYEQEALQQAIQQKQSGGGGGFWKKLGKIASVAAPIVAAPFTGGASLALIGAGAGAANAALSGGGVKGALMGAGMGALGSGGMKLPMKPPTNRTPPLVNHGSGGVYA